MYTDFNKRVFKEIPLGATVLDVGCATGSLGKAIRASKMPKKLVGIEIDPKAQKKASRYYDEILLLDIDVARLPLKKDEFDCVVLADVLEHLKNPSSFLQKLKNHLAPSGIIIISVPNFLFILNRINILFGNLEYSEKGIMDKTHLRLFSLLGFKKLVNDNNFETVKMEGYFNTRPVLAFMGILARIFPSLFAYQLLAVVKKVAR